jgi:fission 1 protein
MEYPTLRELYDPLQVDEFRKIESNYLNDNSAQSKFNYAFALIKQKDGQQQSKGVQLLHEIYKENPKRRQECLYYLAMGEYRLGELKDARAKLQMLLQLDPKNEQARLFMNEIETKLTNEGMVGAAIVGGLVAGAAAIVAALFATKRK